MPHPVKRSKSQKTKQVLVTVIVLNWNGKRFVDPFFNSIQKQDFNLNTVEILFVDNGSTDDSVAYFLSKKYPHARYVQTGANRGFAGGINFGFREAKGDYIVVCNNDLTFDRAWLRNLVTTAQKENADIVVPKLVYSNRKKINNAGSMLRTDSDWPNFERGMGADVSDPDYNQQTDVTAFCGASPLFRRSFLEGVGIFDKHFFLYWEDSDLSWRGQKAGKRYVYEPKSIVYHDASGSTGGETSNTFIYYVSRNRVLVLLKNGSLLLAGRAFAKVFRDHIMYKIWDILKAFRHKRGRKPALRNLKLGIKIIAGILLLTPVCLLKRMGVVHEETL